MSAQGKTKIKVIVAARNCLEWLPHSLDSIAWQRYRNFDVCVVDDSSTQEGQWEWTERFCRRYGWKAYRNAENQGCLATTVRAIRELECEEEDVLVTVDGDDWLAHPDVFSYLDRIYSEGGVSMTYGNFRFHASDKVGNAAPASQHIVAQRLYRSTQPTWCHLRSFKYFLWDSIADEDLRAPSGVYYRFATDHAFMYPMLEMAGRQARCIEEVLYVYNTTNLRSELRSQPITLLATRQHIRSLPCYEVLERCLE